MTSMQKKPTWEALDLQMVNRHWVMTVTVATNRARWRWTVSARSTHDRFGGGRLAYSFTSAKGYSATSLDAQRCAESACEALEAQRKKDIKGEP